MNSREELYFTAYGIPRPQGSKRHVGGGRLVEASNVKPWRAAIADAVFKAMVQTSDERPFTEPVIVYATFFLPKPKTVKRDLPSVPPDLDKLQRALGDALSVDTNILEDDSLIVFWVASKVYVSNPADAGVRVAIRKVTDQEIAEAKALADEIEAANTPEICICCGK